MPTISIMSYSFRGLLGSGQMDVFGYLETCRYRYGLASADIWNRFLVSTDPEYLAKVRNALDERGMSLADLCVDQAHVWDDDPEVRARNEANAWAHLRAGAQLGARFVRIDAGSRRETWSDAEFDHIVGRFRAYSQYAFDHGFRMGAENHWGPEKTWANLKGLYEAVDHPGFGISLHLGSWTGTDDERHGADAAVAPWVCHTHFDQKTCEGPLASKVAMLRASGYEGAWSVEHHSGEEEYARVADQLNRLRVALA